MNTFTTRESSESRAAAMQGELRAMEAELEAQRARRADVGDRLTAARARKEALAVEVASALLEATADSKAPAALRREHAATVTELEEFELATKIGDERVAALEGRVKNATRALQIAVALDQLDRLVAIGARVDAAWVPMHELLAEFAMADADTAAALDRLIPNTVHRRSKERLAAMLLQPLHDTLELPGAWRDASIRGPIAEQFAHERSRDHLERELAELTQEVRA